MGVEGAGLRGARLSGVDLTGAVLRGVEVHRLELDSPWLFEDDNVLLVNGVDVVPYVDAELDRRFPGRALRFAADPNGLRTAWSLVEQAWATTLDRAAAMPDGAVDTCLAGEWSFAQTLRHLVTATDLWLRQAVLEVEEPFAPLGLIGPDADDHGLTERVLVRRDPTYAEVLQVRAERVAMVRDFLATVTGADLDAIRRNPHDPEHTETIRSCLHVILKEEWEHLRYAIRDLDAL